ncbi:hypothetical protein MCEMSEM22_01210 [Comamonadaceae bacterium]
MKIATSTALLACVAAAVCGTVAVVAMPEAFTELAFTSFLVCIGMSWVVTYRSGAMLPGLAGLLGRFNPWATVKAPVALLGFFVSAAFTLGVGCGLLVVLVEAANG